MRRGFCWQSQIYRGPFFRGRWKLIFRRGAVSSSVELAARSRQGGQSAPAQLLCRRLTPIWNIPSYDWSSAETGGPSNLQWPEEGLDDKRYVFSLFAGFFSFWVRSPEYNGTPRHRFSKHPYAGDHSSVLQKKAPALPDPGQLQHYAKQDHLWSSNDQVPKLEENTSRRLVQVVESVGHRVQGWCLL